MLLLFFLTLFQIKESFAEPPECRDLKIVAATSCLQGSGMCVGCVFHCATQMMLSAGVIYTCE